MEGNWRNKDGKEGGKMLTEEDLREAGFCLEEIHQAINRACNVVELMEKAKPEE